LAGEPQFDPATERAELLELRVVGFDIGALSLDRDLSIFLGSCGIKLRKQLSWAELVCANNQSVSDT
jgi:hypothetical protein